MRADRRAIRLPLKLVPAPGEPGRANNLNALRLAMALLVVWSHSFALYLGTESGEPLALLCGGIYDAGKIAVLAFFAMSGFLISQSWERSATWSDYLKKRVARIFPGYLVAVTLCSIVLVPAFSSRSIADFGLAEWSGMASNLLLRNYIVPSDAFGGQEVNGSLWSIPFEFWCYLGVLALGVTGLFRRRWIFPAIAIAVMLVRAWLDLTGRKPGGGVIGDVIGYPYFWFNVLPPFVLGAAVYRYREAIPRSAALLATLIVAFLVACHLPIDGRGHDIAARLVFPPALTYAIFYCAFSPVALGNPARHGDFSYGAYLYAFPIQRIIASSPLHDLPLAVLIPLSMLLAVLAGMASWFAVERWFVRSGARRREGKASGLPPATAGNCRVARDTGTIGRARLGYCRNQSPGHDR